MKPKILIIVGPTASGKSDLAVSLAKDTKGEVISADSRQVYKGLNIGTGKITKKEMKRVPHHLLDVVSTSQLRLGKEKRFAASDYVSLAERAISKIDSKNKLPIICGGTGFYIDALLGEKQIPEVPPNKKLRAELEKKTVEELFKILKTLDGARAKSIDAKNPRRLVRAIEICKALRKVPKPESLKPKENKFEVLKIGIKIEEQELRLRINKRIDKWFKQGLLKEVSDLHKKGLSWKRMSEIGLEYKIVAEYLQNKISKQEMVEKMRVETWQYAKRQMTWFKKDKSIVWFSPDQVEQIKRRVRGFL